ncbi:disease resistance protein At4g27190-like [Rhodamnia argentea]|uniref:Disease resistance protein At4g27190-like n=1 Tax=Rhodamnia argentea TaxID=178133 RepID=A0ABM3HF66_9MYRT|nr:disease resistance protein At4g27190-like [Rhodamnia argentea]
MSTDSAVSIGWDVLKWIVVPVKRQFGYVISSKSYAQDLQKEVGKLAYEADMVHNDVEVARNNSREVYSHVVEWQAKAEKALKEARDLLGDFEKASKTCCYGSLPEPCCRYQFSRKAKHMIGGIQQLAQEFSEFKYISFSGTAPGNAAASTPAKREGKDVVQSTISMASASFASMSIKLKDDGMVQSRELIMQEIMAALADNNNSVVGIYGMGGVGKSTLLDDAERRIKKAKSFDWVAKADVSENQDVKRIQGEIAHALDLDIKDVEYVNSRAERLRTRLENEVREKKKVLIILDNLWKGLDLKSVGIPCGHNNKVIGCKLLLTSRFQDVLRREMGCDRDFLLDALKEEEAKRLFERTVGDKVHHDPFKSLVDEALNKCAGLPFLIIAMANVFRDADFSEWKDVLRQIEMSTNKGISERINEMLQLSYNRFKGEDGKEVKSLLRLCVVYGVSKPSLENLVRYGVGSRLFREDSSMEEVRDRLSSLIRTLKASSFLLENDEDVDGFKIQDLVRGFVASVASSDDPLLVLKNHDKSAIELPKDKLKSCTAVCFPYIDKEELLEQLDCPEMRIFLLFTNNESLKVPGSCFNSMRKLMVLHLSQVRLTRSPSPFQFLENLHTLCLNGCLLDDVVMIGELKWLRVLSFANSKIQRLPKEIGQLVELRLLDLNHCSKLEIIEPGVLGSLMKLEELYMESSFDHWNAVEQTPPTNAGLIELNNLKNLCTLHVSIFDPSVLPEDLNVEKLTKYQIRIGDVPRRRSRNASSTLEVQLDPMSDILRKGCIRTLLGKTDDLFLNGLNGIEQSICALSHKGFPKLKYLQVENSPSVHYILQSPSHTEFKMLESLLLDNLINLEKICNNHISSNSFSALKVVQVENCDKMEVLFPLSLLRELPHLEEIQVVRCHLMREIVEVDDCGKLELRNLHVLKLRDLPNMKNFCTAGMAPSSCTSNDHVGTQVAFFNGQQVAFPSLETLRIMWMDSIEIIWDNQVAAESFRGLKSLIVYKCNKLANIVPSYILGRLKSLESLEVESYARASPLCFQPQ